MTDGILLKEIEADFLLKKYAVIVVDEAHERSLNSDIIVSLLTRIAHARCELAYKERQTLDKQKFEHYPLRIVIMSATLRVEDFKDNLRLFPPKLTRPPNVVSVQTRQFPVTIHFSKVTKDDYVEVAFAKVKKIHSELPPGGILVFLTGKKEILYVVKRLKIELKKALVDSDDEAAQPVTKMKVKVMPLYSALNPEKQYQIF